MFKATKPFNDAVTNYPEEPSLRIGRRVPENAVNLAYYYNPTATDAEKILSAEAPRNTIDHRVEEAYRYLFDQASDDDDLFPGSVWYEDEEGYQGRLGRMYVNWYPEAHVEIKNVTQTKIEIVNDKSNLTKMIQYDDDINDYHGSLYLDATDFKVTKEKDVSTTEILDYNVYTHELNYHQIFGSYIAPSNLDAWMEEPTAAVSTYWPNQITIGPTKNEATAGHATVKSFINNTSSQYDGAIGVLAFESLEYEQVKNEAAKDGEVKNVKTIGSVFEIDVTSPTDLATAKATFKNQYLASYDSDTGSFDYTKIDEFLTMAETYCTASDVPNQNFYKNIVQAKNKGWDIAVFVDYFKIKAVDPSDESTSFYCQCKYKYQLSSTAIEGTYKYNVVANYQGLLKKTIVTTKKVPAEWEATSSYVGIVRKVWHDYDGIAYYRGSVTKGNSVGNVNPEGDNEILMFSDDNGYLRRQITKVGDDGIPTTKNLYRVESDHIYLTDVFKDGIACFYKYPLKKPIYDYRGPDDNGFYEGDAVKLFTASLKDIPTGYKHSMKLKVAETEIVSDVTSDNALVHREVPKRYNAELYTSFISSSTDTFKVVYNAFNDSDDDNIALDNGVTEEIYNYPFMHKGTDFVLETVDSLARINKIKLTKPRYIEDTRRYITFKYTITAERKNPNGSTDEVTSFTTEPRSVSILNRDYVVPAEYNKFDDRAMIISPEIDGILCSPMDLVLHDQAISGQPTVITSKSTDFIFYTTITEFAQDVSVDASRMKGAVNIRCNPDGSGFITAETTLPTGFFDEELGTYTKKLCLDSPYLLENGRIYPGFKVKCVDTRYIKVNAPREDGLLDSWYPMIQFGHYSQILDQYGTHIKVCYSMPEFDTQHFSEVYGKPYVDVKNEQVEILNSHMIKTKCYPLLIKDDSSTISVYKQVGDELFNLDIRDVSYSDGIIVLVDTISENDKIVCDYTYTEENYVYRGFWRNLDDFARIDLNPNMYHTYSDLTYTPSETKPSKNLFNKVIYFFMRPTVEYEVSADNDSLIFDIEDDSSIGKINYQNKSTLYHKIDDAQPDSDHDIAIGSVYIRQNTSLHSTILIDSRTRGGGVLESMKDSLRRQLEPESDFYLDIGYYDGEPYQENGVIIVRLDNSILKEFGGRFTQGDIEQKVKRWLGYGVYPIIEYVDSYSKRDMPQYNLQVEDSYINVTNETPEILLECVTVS